MVMNLMLLMMVKKGAFFEFDDGDESNVVDDGALLQQVENGTAFYGVNGTLSVCNPRVEKGQLSQAHISVLNGYPNKMNVIVVGWESDNFTRGCTNLQCQGFVQTDKSIILGQSFNQTSTIDGLVVELPLAILQDPKNKNWYIYIGNKEIGYYPASLFSNMKSANQVMWMGKTITPTHIPCPPMGSGVKPNGVLGHACYFKNLAFVNDSRKHQTLEKDMGQIQSSNQECYGATYYDVDKIGLTIQFGGPGGDSVINPKISDHYYAQERPYSN
ncbi:hypothetical protein QL285_077127 [Trifolium repens]|nr:hypothetical protein QL285_077127 [Trifolium repens]